MLDPHDYLQEILIPADGLQQRIAELGREVSVDYAGKTPLLVCILRGGVMFLTDLMRQLTVPHAIDFMSVASYGAGAREATGSVRIEMDLRTDIEGRDVLIVEDIIDTGHTMRYILQVLEARGPASVKICTLLNKAQRREVDVPIDYIGFDIPNKFVFGYGLDLDEYFRNLPFVGVVKPGSYIPFAAS
jgi:hypoxanthine phosphoribosyltransferase